MNQEKRQPDNYLKTPVEFLWDQAIPLELRIRLLVASYHPVGIPIQTMVNILGASRESIRDALKKLVRKGAIARDDGKAFMVVEGLPDAEEQKLKCLRGFHVKMAKRTGIPVPLKNRLLGQRKSATKNIPYRFPEATLSWLAAKGAFESDNLRTWAYQYVKKIQGSDNLRALGDYLIESAAVPVPNDEAVMGWIVEGIRLMDASKPVHSVCKMISHLLKERDEEGDVLAPDDRLRPAFERWQELLESDPLEKRQTVSEFLAEQDAEDPEEDGVAEEDRRAS